MELLHGVLEVVVYEAKNLPTTLRLRATGCLKTLVCCGMGPELTGRWAAWTRSTEGYCLVTSAG